MIPGIGGRLVSSSFVEQYLVPGVLRSGDGPAIAALGRDLTKWWRMVCRTLGPASGARQVFDVAVGPLLTALGHQAGGFGPHAGGLLGMLQRTEPTVAVGFVLPWAARLEPAWRDAVRGGLVTNARWALISNGHSLRIIDCQRPWSRLSVELEMGAILADPRGAAVLWALARATAVGGHPGEPSSLASAIAESGRHSAHVCRSLGDGVLEALPVLASALAAAPSRPTAVVPVAHTFEQALTIVYRVLFLLFAEARGLVPVWNEVYREGYTIDALCRRITERPAAPGLWLAFQAISRMAHAGCRAGDLDVTAFNGRLFSPEYAPLVHQRQVPDAVVKRIVMALATTEARTGRHRIGYHDLGVEQLGSVYERVLDFAPTGHPRSVVLTPNAAGRKSSGSFYTPRAITEFLVRRTLHPLVEGKSAPDILALRIVDPAMGSGAFLVAACRYLADQCERANLRDGVWNSTEVTVDDRALLRRQVAERCLYGVDLNPTAVQLARLSLWLTTLASDRPLTFLDHHLAVGDSLIGAGVAELARRPAVGRRARRRVADAPLLPMFEDEVADVMASQVLPERARLALGPSDTLADVRQKERRLAALSATGGPSAAWSRAANIWCGVSLWTDQPPTSGLAAELLASTLGTATTLADHQLRRWIARAGAIADDHSVFHWPLMFPEVFFDDRGRLRADGGFDAVIGNPPWEMIRLDGPEVRVADRGRKASQLRFFRASGLYHHQGDGHPNRYQLFLERVWHLTRPGGRFGLIVPSGLATDPGSAALRRHLLGRCGVDTWIGFENRRAIFPIHRSVRFVLLAATNAGTTERLQLSCGLHDTTLLDRCPSGPGDGREIASVTVSRTRLEAWDPVHLTIPELTSDTALGISTQAAEVAPALAAATGWSARFGRELNATDDRPHLVATPPGPRRHRDRDLLPIVEGKHLSPFRVALDDTTLAVDVATAGSLVAASATFGRARLAYRDVASATNRVTLIAAFLPRRTLSTHTVFCLKTLIPARSQWCLLALLNSLVANYLVRLRVTTHVTTALMAALPVPKPAPGSPVFEELVRLARRLARHGIDGAPHAYARLNALVARLYGLTPDQYRHVVGSFPLLAEDLRALCVGAHLVTPSLNH